MAAVLLPTVAAGASRTQQPNVLFLLTDDQDTMLGGDSEAAMPVGLPGLTAAGARLENWFVHTPVCACSRAEILTGRYFHNLADTALARDDPWDRRGNSNGPCYPDRKGAGCGAPETAPGRNMHLNFTKLSPGPSVFAPLAEAGYRVGVFGKYLNRLPVHPSGRPQIPTGVAPEDWFVSPGDESNKASRLDPSGEYYPSFYFEGNGVWNNSALEYETAFLGNRSVAWIQEAASGSAPWFLYLAPHAPHGAALPAPWYTTLTVDTELPRLPSWNVSAPDHHWLVAQQPPLAEREADAYDRDFKRRWQCLRAVDDTIAVLHAEIARLGIADSTYIFATADHGYHFGELRLPQGKWNVYDTDVRVPMRVSGPGITPGSTIGLVGSHVDLAPTWLGLAGIDAPSEMDGRSLVAGLIDTEAVAVAEDHADALPASVLSHLRRSSAKRTTGTGTGTLPVGGAYIEYHGLGPTGSPGRLGDAFNNTYRALRVIDHRTPHGLGNVLYAEFGTDYFFNAVYAREYFDLDADPYQIHNTWSSLAPAAQQAWAARITALSRCKGKGCGMAPA